MKNFKLTVEYDGSRYSGWQRQGNTNNTIQHKFEEILFKMLGVKTEIFASGRTDSGVHAKGQVFNFKCETTLTEIEIKLYINKYLPEDIRVLSVESVDMRFHSRLSVKSKTYQYRMFNGSKCPVFERKYVTCVNETPDIEIMKKGAEKLVGKFDFKGFSTKTFKKSTFREIYDICINAEGDFINITITGNGFLYNMVRIITGTLYELGTGKRDLSSIDEILEKCDRSLAGITMPPQGLCLLKVDY
ncbi:MAG: tRNA pseudouridine(38-40) synthase TruA [Clostridia bacterium]|nr:tRNA pseudouridine(38-40) synthase TruA [Clostridia bacterium]